MAKSKDLPARVYTPADTPLLPDKYARVMQWENLVGLVPTFGAPRWGTDPKRQYRGSRAVAATVKSNAWVELSDINQNGTGSHAITVDTAIIPALIDLLQQAYATARGIEIAKVIFDPGA